MCFMFYNCYYMHERERDYSHAAMWRVSACREREREFAQVLDVLFFPVLLVYCL